jgi:hypothetical protein
LQLPKWNSLFAGQTNVSFGYFDLIVSIFLLAISTASLSAVLRSFVPLMTAMMA